jgi:hypothetical protein
MQESRRFPVINLGGLIESDSRHSRMAHLD